MNFSPRPMGTTPMPIITTLLLLFVSVVFFSACAVVRPPDGGPEDKTPPIVELADANFSETNFRGSSVRIVFSESVERARAEQSISLSPEKPMSFSWSGTYLTIGFTEPPDSATTYALTVGTQYADLHGNTPLAATTFVFSTGTFLDKGSIRGLIQDDKPQGLLVYLYSLNTDTSTVRWGETKSRWKTQVGTDGSFSFSALPAGRYRLITLRDNDNDGVFTFGTDAVATSANDIVIESDAATPCLLRMSPAADITPPELIDVRPRSSTRFDVQWSEPISPQTLSPSSFLLTDTTGRDTVSILAVYPASVMGTTWTFITQSIRSEVPLRLVLSRIGTTPADTAGNRLADTAQAVFTPSTLTDPIVPRLLTSSLRDSTSVSDCLPELAITWSTAIVSDSSLPGFSIRCLLGSRPQPIRIARPSSNRIVVCPADTLPFDTWFEWSIVSRSLPSVTGVKIADTSFTIRLRTPDTRLFGSIRGNVVDSSGTKEPIVVRLCRGTVEVRRLVTTPGVFAFTSLPPGEYSIDVFADRNNDGRYTSGAVKPWEAAERFAPLKKQLSVRSRWTLDDVRITIPGR